MAFHQNLINLLWGDLPAAASQLQYDARPPFDANPRLKAHWVLDHDGHPRAHWVLAK